MEFLTEPVSHDEAVDFIKSKPAVTRSVFDKLLPELKARAFTVAGLEQASTLQAVRDQIAELPKGGDWDTIKQEIAAKVSPFLVDPDADPEVQAQQQQAGERRAELLLRLHGFQAYSAAAYRALDANRDVFPYWQYKSMGDGKVRHTHRALHDVALPADDPFWNGHYPPWEWGCRCQVVGLMKEDVDEIRAADDQKPLEQRRIIEGEARKQLVENGRLVRGPSEIYDVRTPVQRGAKGAFAWSPGDLRISLADLKARYDAPVWDAFEAWARSTPLNESDTAGGPLRSEYRRGRVETHGNIATVWDWLTHREYENNKQNERSKTLPQGPSYWGVDPDPRLARRVGRDAEEVFRDLYDGLPAQIPYSKIAAAEIGAVAGGTKPLYHEELDLAADLAAALRPLLPATMEATAWGDHLIVWNRQAVKTILDSDKDFYRPHSETDTEAILRAVSDSAIGELLGYGQRTMQEPDSSLVIFQQGDMDIAGFRTPSATVAAYASARAADYEDPGIFRLAGGESGRDHRRCPYCICSKRSVPLTVPIFDPFQAPFSNFSGVVFCFSR